MRKECLSVFSIGLSLFLVVAACRTVPVLVAFKELIEPYRVFQRVHYGNSSGGEALREE